VGIADVEDRGLGVRLGSEGRTIAAGLAGADRTALDDLRVDPRDLADVPLSLGPGDASVQREPGPDEIEAVVAPEADPRGVGEAVALRRNRRRDRPKALELNHVQRMILIRAGEVTVQRID